MGIITGILYFVLSLLDTLILVRCLCSFFFAGTKGYYILCDLTEPVILPFRKLLSKLNLSQGMFDFSPLLAMIAINILLSLL